MLNLSDPTIQSELARIDAVRGKSDTPERKQEKWNLKERWKTIQNLTENDRYLLGRALYGEPKDDPRKG